MIKFVGRCRRCWQQLAAIEITVLGDYEPVFEPLPCSCPGPRCPWCQRRLDDDGHCYTIECWAFGLIIPIPDVA